MSGEGTKGKGNEGNEKEMEGNECVEGRGERKAWR